MSLHNVETNSTTVYSENPTTTTTQIIDNSNLLKTTDETTKVQLSNGIDNQNSINQMRQETKPETPLTNKTEEVPDQDRKNKEVLSQQLQKEVQDQTEYKEPIADNKHTQTLSSEDEHQPQTDKEIEDRTEQTPIRINSIKTQQESSSEEENSDIQFPKKTEKPKHKPQKENNPKEILDISTCFKSLFQHLTDFCFEIQQGIFVVIGYALYTYLEELGLQIGVTLFVMYQFFLYIRKNKTNVPQKINAMSSTQRTSLKEDQTKTIYDNLKIPTSNKLKLKKKLRDFKNERTKLPYQLPSDFEDSLIIEEPVELKSYASKVPNHLKFVVRGAVNNVPVIWEMDSGSSITLISDDIFDKMENKDTIKKIPLHATYTDFQGTTVATKAKYLLPIRIGEKVHTTQEVLVVDHPDKSQSHALLGVDIIRAKRLGRDMMGNSKAYLSFSVGNETKRIELQTRQDCFVTNTIEIEAGETETVRLSLLNNINRINLTNIQDITGTQGVVTCEDKENYHIPTVSLCNLDQLASFQIPIKNKHFGTLKLFAGQPLGSFAPLEEGTILQSTSNVIETIEKGGKGTPNLGTTILKLSEHLNKVDQRKVKFIKPTNINEGYQVQINLENTEPKVTEGKKIILPKQTSMSDLDTWRKILSQIKKSDKSYPIRIDFSELPVISANYIQIAWHDMFGNLPTNLQLTHRDLQIQKTSLVSDSSEESSDAPSEDDLCESFFQTRRITSTADTWTSLLKHVPVYLRKKVFYLLTTKYPEVIAKSTVDFGECTLPNSEFTIELKDNSPITCRPYPLNVVYKDAIEETVSDMVQNGLLIQESSAFGSGVFVRKERKS